MEAAICFINRYALILLILINNERFFLFLDLNFIIRFTTYVISWLRLKTIIVMLTILAEEKCFVLSLVHQTKFDLWENN